MKRPDETAGIVTTGRHIGEVIEVPRDRIGHYRGLAMLWHDQTGVGNYDAAIRMPEHLYAMLAARHHKAEAALERVHRAKKPPSTRWPPAASTPPR